MSAKDRGGYLEENYPHLWDRLFDYETNGHTNWVSLGPDGTFFASMTKGNIYDLPDSIIRKCNLKENPRDIACLALGIGDCFICVRKSGHRTSNVRGEYPSLARIIEERERLSGRARDIKAVTLDFSDHTEEGYAILFEDGYFDYSVEDRDRPIFERWYTENFKKSRS